MCFNPRTHTGCDLVLSIISLNSRSFNPRTHTGCDANSAHTLLQLIVSIHAPTRGATQNKNINTYKGKFQSTHPHGVRLKRKVFRILLPMFQSTHPHGVRLGIFLFYDAKKRVSIHAATRGATEQMEGWLQDYFVSIHAPTRGATPNSKINGTLTNGFNPRTHTGCDLLLFDC